MLLPTPTQTFDRIERAHAAWTRGGATIEVVNVTATGTERAQYRFDLDGHGGATLRIRMPAQGKLAATDQGYVLRSAAIFGVDYVAREAIRRPAPDRGSVSLRLAAVLGGLNDAVGFLASKADRERYLLPLKGLRGWRTTKEGLVLATASAGKSSQTKLSLDASGRLRNLHIELPDSRLDWKFSYRPYSPLPIPRGLRLVEAFTARPRPPQYVDARAKRITETLLARTAGLSSAIVRLDNVATLWISGSKIRYESGEAGFSYDGRRLTVVTPGAAYQGRSSRRAVIDQVASLLGTVDPFVRSVLVRAPLFLELFPPEAKVRVVGSSAIAGVPCEMVEVSGPRVRSTIFARKADGLPASVETSTLDRRGNDLSATRREFKWNSVGAPLASSLFELRIRPGQRVLPLPTVRSATAP